MTHETSLFLLVIIKVQPYAACPCLQVKSEGQWRTVVLCQRRSNLLALVVKVLKLFLNIKTALRLPHSFCITIYFQDRKRKLELPIIPSGSW